MFSHKVVPLSIIADLGECPMHPLACLLIVMTEIQRNVNKIFHQVTFDNKNQQNQKGTTFCHSHDSKLSSSKF